MFLVLQIFMIIGIILFLTEYCGCLAFSINHGYFYVLVIL